MTQFNAALHQGFEKPYIEGYSGDQLDPGEFPADGVQLVAPPANLAPRDYLFFYMDEDELDWTRVPAAGPGTGVKIHVAKETFTARRGQEVDVYYQVSATEQGARSESTRWRLTLGSAFEGDVLLDLSPHDYVVSADKPPRQIPEFAQLKREASGGVAPYRYTSSEPKVATVDDSGQVTALANGVCQITATDSQDKVLRYSLTVKGIRRVHFLTPRADWAGMKLACDAANLIPVPLSQLKRLWRLYDPSSRPVGAYLGYLPYVFWTADQLGAGTAYVYDLDGSDAEGNASTLDEREYRQVLGIDPD
ncbi:Ig-like domain-containing protein [Pseudomonas sp. GZD-222]|uniref:Ig-like domain-containing protein n=1 Tax=Pseudomonas sp. GZD-222 TaxID=3404805 RepID=UPI003BB571CE